MSELVPWLLEQFSEDEQIARAADGDDEVAWLADDARDHYLPAAGAHVERHLPSYVLADVAAKRAVLAAYGEPAARLFVAAYAARRGYRGEWGIVDAT